VENIQVKKIFLENSVQEVEDTKATLVAAGSFYVRIDPLINRIQVVTKELPNEFIEIEPNGTVSTKLLHQTGQAGIDSLEIATDFQFVISQSSKK